MREPLRLAAGAGFLALAALAAAADPPLPRPEGFVTDRAAVLSPAARARLTELLTELRQKTGAEIAVVTVDTTAPLDDFTYAMRLAEAWKPGRRREDTGVVFLVAVRDRKLRVLTGYGLEGILPDGLVGEIQDEEVVPAFRAGRLEEGITRGVTALAARIAAERGVRLTGVPPPRRRPPPWEPPGWVLALVVLALLVFLAVVVYGSAHSPHVRRRGDVPPFGYGGGGFGSGGFGGGGGGFGGFGGGSFGGGGAGRSW